MISYILLPSKTYMEIIIGLIILLYSAILHEIAHGVVADRLGDPTARLLGRLTLNPKSHIDPWMSIGLPLLLLVMHSPVLFGAAKPVPVDPFNLRDGRKDMALVALAGPLTNVCIAVFAASLFKLFDLLPIVFPAFLGSLLFDIARINLLLAVFNLIPIPPLDGSKVFSLFLPDNIAAQYLSIGTMGMILLFFLLTIPGGFGLGTIMSQIVFFALKLLGLI
jgi:Zn-dependent protease